MESYGLTVHIHIGAIELSNEEVMFRCKCEGGGGVVGCFRESRIMNAQIKQSSALVYITAVLPVQTH